MRYVCTLSIFLYFVVVTTATPAERSYQLPTATEVFQLRSACAALGQQILEGNFIGSALTQDQVSHYNPRTNRCYVELTVQTADLSKGFYLSRCLYDGQTREMLASATIEKDKKHGMVYDKQHRTTTLEHAGWDDAAAYIDAMMADDRQ
jgi:hypothetical protein